MTPRRVFWTVARLIGGQQMTTTARDEYESEFPGEADPLGAAVAQVIAAIFEALPVDCAERRAA